MYSTSTTLTTGPVNSGLIPLDNQPYVLEAAKFGKGDGWKPRGQMVGTPA